jgi:excisionase family DNA binding protein
MSNHYISIAQVAERLEVHPATVRRYLARGILRGYRVGPRLLRVRADDVEALREPLGAAR